VKYRSEWIKYQEAQRRKEEEELEKERGVFWFTYFLAYLYIQGFEAWNYTE
jgi:hypothetical protein